MVNASTEQSKHENISMLVYICGETYNVDCSGIYSIVEYLAATENSIQLLSFFFNNNATPKVNHN